MKPVIDMHQCLQDSPKFRVSLNENEDNLEILEVKLEKLVKLCHVMVETGKAFNKSKGAFVNGIWELSVYFNEDAEVVSPLNRIIQSLTELNKFNHMLIDHTSRAVGRTLGNFVKNDIHKVKETKRHFDRISEELDTALQRNATAAKGRPADCEEAHNLLTATRSCFRHTALDYICQIGCLQSKKRHLVLDSLLSLMKGQGTYFHQGSDLFQDGVEPFIKDADAFVEKLRENDKSLQRKLQGHHALVTTEDNHLPKVIKDNVRMAGYLFKRTSNAFKTWNRRWFTIKDNQLVYQKRNEFEITVMEEDLRLCNVKPVTECDRRFCFEILSPSKAHVLQADTEESCRQWIAALESGIDAAYNNQPTHESVDKISVSGSSTSTDSNPNLTSPQPTSRSTARILGIAGNDSCCECGSPEPKWASINLGIVLCIECSGIHRSLGVHISKVRSLNLDDWDPEVVRIMLKLGNEAVNRVLEERSGHEWGVKRITKDSSRAEREAWVKAKYISRSFVEGVDSGQGLLLYAAAANSDLLGMFEALARGADVNWSNLHDDGKTALHVAVSSKCVTSSEFLLLNGAKCNQVDSLGRTCLHLAAESSNTGQVCLLLKRGADQGVLDKQGRDALSIAVNNANADIVTIMRLAKLNDEMRQDEYGTAQDEIFNEVVRDFSNMASSECSEKIKQPEMDIS